MHKKTLFLLVGLALPLLLDACDGCNNHSTGGSNIDDGKGQTGQRGNNNSSGGSPQLPGDNNQSGGSPQLPENADLFSWEGINTKNIFQANAWIDGTDQWLTQLGINKNSKETIVVNAANSHIASPGGGIDGALGRWARVNGTTPWTSPASTLPNGEPAPSRLPAGEFALFPVPFGHIYLAVGPRASDTKTLAETAKLLSGLCFNMLDQAQKDGRKRVVLCAISTAIFANAGTESDTNQKFTKEEFLKSAYAGLKSGIVRFQRENQDNTLKIILNNWGSDDEIGKKVVAGLRHVVS